MYKVKDLERGKEMERGMFVGGIVCCETYVENNNENMVIFSGKSCLFRNTL